MYGAAELPGYRRHVSPKLQKQPEKQLRPEWIPGPHFSCKKEGENITFRHPVTNALHTLTVQGYGAQTVESRHFRDDKMEFPTHFVSMAFTVEPPVSRRDMQVKDCEEGDRPRQKPAREGDRLCEDRFRPVSACSVGIIRGASGVLLLSDNKEAELHRTASSLHFEPAAQVEWRMVFSRKILEDRTVELFGRSAGGCQNK